MSSRIWSDMTKSPIRSKAWKSRFAFLHLLPPLFLSATTLLLADASLSARVLAAVTALGFGLRRVEERSTAERPHREEGDERRDSCTGEPGRTVGEEKLRGRNKIVSSN